MDRLGDDAPRKAYVSMLLAEGMECGLLHQNGSQLTMAEHGGLPEASLILSTFAAEYPMASADLALAAQAEEALPDILNGLPVPAPRAALVQRYEGGSCVCAPRVEPLRCWPDSWSRGPMSWWPKRQARV
jgi:hypothetical protein